MTDRQPNGTHGGVKKLPEELMRILRKLREGLFGIDNVTNVVLFGSYSKGTYGKDSDVDVAVFVINGTEENLKRVYHEAQSLTLEFCQYDIQILVFDETALACPVGIVEEIVEYGTDIREV